MRFTTLLNYHLIDCCCDLDDLILGFCYSNLTQDTSGLDYHRCIIRANHLSKWATFQWKYADKDACLVDCCSNLKKDV